MSFAIPKMEYPYAHLNMKMGLILDMRKVYI